VHEIDKPYDATKPYGPSQSQFHGYTTTTSILQPPLVTQEPTSTVPAFSTTPVSINRQPIHLPHAEHTSAFKSIAVTELHPHTSTVFLPIPPRQQQPPIEVPRVQRATGSCVAPTDSVVTDPTLYAHVIKVCVCHVRQLLC
jgi:hypothetical protein